jgi:hypothetical protein
MSMLVNLDAHHSLIMPFHKTMSLPIRFIECHGTISPNSLVVPAASPISPQPFALASSLASCLAMRQGLTAMRACGGKDKQLTFLSNGLSVCVFHFSALGWCMLQLHL